MQNDNFNLKTDRLLKAVGNSVNSLDGDFMGKIVEITRDSNGQYIEYLILKSDECFGRGTRFFAIPASSSLVKMSYNGTITLQAHKDDVQFSKGVVASQCPKPNFKIGQNIYELYMYKNKAEDSIPNKN